MAEIIKFPNKEQKRIRLRRHLTNMIAQMDEYYDQIDEIMKHMCNLEDEVSEIEVSYSKLLREYARETEKSKLETRLLAYCKDADVRWDGDKKEVIFTLIDSFDEEIDE